MVERFFVQNLNIVLLLLGHLVDFFIPDRQKIENVNISCLRVQDYFTFSKLTILAFILTLLAAPHCMSLSSVVSFLSAVL